MKKLILLLFVGMASLQNYAQNQYLKKGLATEGYDVVAYFESAKPIEGKKGITTKYNGAIYQFSSESNKALFLNNPTQYVPQFGGYCAYGVSENHTSPTDPKAFTIVDNKLYLNYNLEVKELWSKEQEERIKSANENWETLKKQHFLLQK